MDQFFAAAACGDLGVIQAVLERLTRDDVDPGVLTDSNGFTVLHIAALNGQLEAVKQLVLGGMSYRLTDSQGRTAAELALAAGHTAVYEYFLQHAVSAELIMACMGESDDDDDGDEESSKPFADFLQKRLHYEAGRLLDSDGNAVMMGWETPLMVRHAEVMCPAPGLDVLNVGFGLGIIDTELQKRRPRTHTIIEAHPDVYAYMLSQGWDRVPGVRILFGRWEDVCDQLQTYDAIFFDTFGEDYSALRGFHELLPNILRESGTYSFFNGLAATNPFLHEVYQRVAALHLEESCIETTYVPVPIDVAAAEWQGVKRAYWSLPVYNLPICRFSQSLSTSGCGCLLFEND